jgi:hypothetical protein
LRIREVAAHGVRHGAAAALAATHLRFRHRVDLRTVEPVPGGSGDSLRHRCRAADHRLRRYCQRRCNRGHRRAGHQGHPS